MCSSAAAVQAILQIRFLPPCLCRSSCCNSPSAAGILDHKFNLSMSLHPVRLHTSSCVFRSNSTFRTLRFTWLPKLPKQWSCQRGACRREVNTCCESAEADAAAHLRVFERLSGSTVVHRMGHNQRPQHAYSAPRS